MELLSLLIIPLVGAVIGYSTNLLAITMLFRPHKEKRIFGLRLPFTPGLIPKQRWQLAQKIGETLAENVFTSRTLIEAASNASIVENITRSVCDFAEKILSSPDAVSKILSDLLKLPEEEIVRVATHGLDKLLDFAHNRIEGKKFADIIPAAAVSALKTAAKDNIHMAAPICRNILDDPGVDAHLRRLVGKIVKENTRGLLSLFVSPDKIYDSIAENLLKYLEDEENHMLIYEKLVGFADAAMEKEISFRPERVITLEKMACVIMSITPRHIFPNAENFKPTLDKLVRNAVGILARQAADHVVGSLNIVQIAEEKINAFKTEEMEQLVLSVVGEQLKWIALLGGLLGFIMGFFPAILNIFM